MDERAREAERAWRAAPHDLAAQLAYARLLLRAGARSDACAVLGILWRATLEHVRVTSYDLPRPVTLQRMGRRLEAEAVAALVGPDLERLDPVLLATHFPRRADGQVRLKTTRYLRRYPVRGLEYPEGSLTLLATSGDTLSDLERERRLIVVELQLRRSGPRFRQLLLPPEHWRS